MDMNIEPSHVVEISTAPSSSPKKLTVPLIGLERFPTQQEIEGQDARTRRPVRPIDRQRMRPWLMELLDMGNVFGLRWTNRHQGIFQISWRHASRLGWNLETDGDVFERWARHTGIYKEGDPPEPKRWKANFRCALHSLTDVLELTNAVERRGRNACRTYQFLQNSSSTNPKSKTKKPKTEVKVQRNIIPLITYEQPPVPEPEPVDLVESASSDELLSETESEGSQKDKVIVQRLEAKSQGGEEEYLLHHDHDYSAGPLKTQKTIYLRQGVGSIVLQKEVTSAPEDAEEVKSYLLSNLDQLASAAVCSENIIMQRSPVAGLVDSQASIGSTGHFSPSKAVFDLTFSDNIDKTEYNLKSLLPRLRARIKESEKAGGLVRKRKGSNVEIDFNEVESLEPKVKVKKDKIDKDSNSLSPPSPPMTRRRSGSPKKAVKVVAKSKRGRKESEESTSDSTEPLMSSCLLLLEAATRLDNAEKNGSSSNKTSSKANKKAITHSTNLTADGKRRTSGRILRSDMRVEDQVQDAEEGDANNESVMEERYEIVIQEDDVCEVSQEMVIEEEVYPEDAVEVIYETGPEQTEADVIDSDSSADITNYHDLLRATLENIGSELEVSTVEASVANPMPKEMAIMRRKRDPDKTSSLNVVELSGQADTTSSPKGLFSGSDIITDTQQQLSIVRKRIKSKGKTSPKENIYYVDIRANGGSICVKQSDDTEVEEKESVSSQVTNPLVKNAIGIQQTVIKRELPVLTATHSQKMPSQVVSSASLLRTPNSSGSGPQIFITSTQNTKGQQIIVPISSGGLITSPNSSVELSDPQTDSVQVQQIGGQTNQGNSFITMGPHGKAVLYKSDSLAKLPQRTAIIPLLNQVASSGLASNVKISTLPIMSSVKPSVNTSVPVSTEKGLEQTVLTTNSMMPIKFVPKLSSQTDSSNPGSTQLAAISSGGKAWILQPRTPAPDAQVSKATAVRMLSPAVIATGQPIIKAISNVKSTDTGKSILPVSVNLSTSVSGPSKTSGRSVVSINPTFVTDQTQISVDPVQVEGSLIQPSIAQLPAPQTSDLSSSFISKASNCTTSATDQSPSTSLSTDVSADTSHSLTAGPVKAEISDAETGVSSQDIIPESNAIIDPQVQSDSSVIHENFPSITGIKDLEGALIKIEHLEENTSQFVSHQLTTDESQESDGKGPVYHVIESMTDSDAASAVAVDVIVKTDGDDQQIYLSAEIENQSDHIVHTSETVANESLTPEMGEHELSKLDAVSESETPESTPTPNVAKEEICLEISSKEEIVSQRHHHHEPLSMDPRTPLAIGEIPLFAASKGDIDYMGSPISD